MIFAVSIAKDSTCEGPVAPLSSLFCQLIGFIYFQSFVLDTAAFLCSRHKKIGKPAFDHTQPSKPTSESFGES